MAQGETVPYYSPVLEGGKELISSAYYHFLDNLRQQVDANAQVAGSTALTVQGAAIGATTILVTQFSGLYRFTWYLRITTAATTSSSATVTLGFTESGVPLTKTFTAVTGNTIQTIASETFLLRSDAPAPITFAVAYASTGATSMVYRLDVLLEQVG